MLAILSAVGLIAVNTLGRSADKSQSRAVAQELALQLINQKQEAARTGLAVGMAFPGSGTFVSQGYYQFRGLGTQRIVRMRSLGGEYPGTFITWGVHGGETSSEFSQNSSLRLDSLPVDDPVVVFLPSGEVLARGVAVEQDYIKLRVGSDPQGAGAAKNAEVSGMNDCWTVQISREGQITTEALPSFPSGRAGSQPGLARLPQPTTQGTAPPVLDSIVTHPELVANPDGSLRVSGLSTPVRLEAKAESPQGDPLFIRWQSDGGQFTHSGRWHPMTYSTEDDRWTASTMWSLPPEPDGTYRIRVEVRDEMGNLAESTSDKEVEVRPGSESLWLFCMETENLPSSGPRPVGAVSWNVALRADGSSKLNITKRGGRFIFPFLVSPNGEHVLGMERVFVANSSYILPRFFGIDGAEISSGTSSLQQYYEPIRWKSDGTGFFASALTSGVGGRLDFFDFSVETGQGQLLFSIPTNTTSFKVGADRDLKTIVFAEKPPWVGVSDTRGRVKVYRRESNSLSELIVYPAGYDHAPGTAISSSGKYALTIPPPLMTGEKVRLHNLETGAIDAEFSYSTGLSDFKFGPQDRYFSYRSGGLTSKNLNLLRMDGSRAYQCVDCVSSGFSPDGASLFVSKASGELLRVNLLDFSEERVRGPGPKPLTILDVASVADDRLFR